MSEQSSYQEQKENLPKDKINLDLLKDAENGDPGAQFHIGYLYSEGHDVKKDLEKAAEWLKKSAGQGNSLAEDLLEKIQNENKAPEEQRLCDFFGENLEKAKSFAQERAQKQFSPPQEKQSETETSASASSRQNIRMKHDTTTTFQPGPQGNPGYDGSSRSPEFRSNQPGQLKTQPGGIDDTSTNMGTRQKIEIARDSKECGLIPHGLHNPKIKGGQSTGEVDPSQQQEKQKYKQFDKNLNPLLKYLKRFSLISPRNTQVPLHLPRAPNHRRNVSKHKPIGMFSPRKSEEIREKKLSQHNTNTYSN